MNASRLPIRDPIRTFGCCAAAVRAMPPTDITTYLFTAALGAVILFLFLIRFVYSKPPPPPTQLSTPAQRERRARIRASVLSVAKSLRRAHRDDHDHGAALECLASLRQIMDGLMNSGHEGMVTFTEFCSACLDAEALDAMKELQDESEDARLLFEAVVPRIWCS